MNTFKNHVALDIFSNACLKLTLTTLPHGVDTESLQARPSKTLISLMSSILHRSNYFLTGPSRALPLEQQSSWSEMTHLIWAFFKVARRWCYTYRSKIFNFLS